MPRIKDTLAGIIAFVFSIDREKRTFLLHRKIKFQEETKEINIEKSKDSCDNT